MPSAGMRKLVDPIPGEPSPYGLLGGCVDVVTTSDPHELNGTEFVPMSCNEARTFDWCPPDDSPGSPGQDVKEFDRPGVCSFPAITVYAGITCSTFGMSFEEGQARAREQLRLGEQRALEEWFMAEGLCDMAAGNDLTPDAGAVSVAQGVATLENWLASMYGGQGLIHAPAGAAALMGCCHIVTRDRDGGCPETLMGNGVVFGAGYAINVGGAGCEQAAPGEGWLYVTGPVRVRRDAPSLTLNAESQSVDRALNDRYALAETTFVVEVACCEAASVRVTLCP